MLPVLLDLKFLKIYTFGVFLVLAFFWSTFLLWKNARLTSYKEEDIFDGVFLSMFGGLFLGRLVYVLLHFNKFGFDIFKFILINGYPGISLYGCLIGFFLTFWLFCSLKKIKFTEIADYGMAPLLIGLGIGKIGSFFSGTEVGTKTTFFLSLKYANFDGYRHLTAFYEGILFFLGAFICHKLLFATRRDKYDQGKTFFFFCWYFNLVYFIFDPLKTNKVLVGGQSVNWVIALPLLLTFSLYFLYHLRSKIFGSMTQVTNLKFKHAKTHTTVHKPATEEVGGGTGENQPADSEVKSG